MCRASALTVALLRARRRSGCCPRLGAGDLAQADAATSSGCRRSGSRGRPTLEHYGEVLFSSSRTARIGRAFVNSAVVSLGTVVVVGGDQRAGRLPAGAHAVPRARRGLRDDRRQPDGAERRRPRPAVRADPAARMAQHLPGADRARGRHDLRVRRLPAAPVLPRHAGRARGRRADRRRQRVAGLHAHRAAAVAARARRAGDLRLPLGLERLPLAADRREQAGDVPAARSRWRCCAAPTAPSPTGRSWPAPRSARCRS